MLSNRQKRSIVTVGWVRSNIFQWDSCRWQDDGTKRKFGIYNSNYTWTK